MERERRRRQKRKRKEDILRKYSEEKINSSDS